MSVDSDKAIVWTDDDGVVHVRNSERGTLDRCPQQWWWSWREALRAKEVAKPLWFGSAIHEALADYYRPGKKRSKDYIDKFREYVDMEAEYIKANVGSEPDEAEWVDARTLGETMLTEYAKEYRGDKHWNVIGTEQSFAVQIPFFEKGRKLNWIDKQIQKAYGDYFILNGTFDGVYRDERDRNRAKLMEHKTAGSVSVRHLPMDNQGGTYWLVAATVGHDAGWLEPKERLTDITYNFLRKALPDPRQRDPQGYCLNKPGKDAYIESLTKIGYKPEAGPRGGVKWPTIERMAEIAAEYDLTVYGERSKSQPPPLFERHPVRKSNRQRATQLTRLQAEVRRMCMMTLGLVEVTKQPDRNVCPMCPFNEMCELHEMGSDWQDYRDALFRVEDLYGVHYKKSASA